MATILKDPESARYAFAAPQKAWVPFYYVDERSDPDGGFHPGHLYGWTVDFTVNSKNSYGGYVGSKPYRAFFQDKQIRVLLDAIPHTDIFGYASHWVVWRDNAAHASTRAP